MSSPALEIRNLWAGYGDQKVLRGVDLKLDPGSIVALIGANGAGSPHFTYYFRACSSKRG